MAVRTISAAGGNWNSTATWVGGVIPTTSDHVVGDASSGQLTVNVNATVQYVDFSAYTQTLTITNFLQTSLASATNVFGSGMSFAGTGNYNFYNSPGTIIYNTTNRLPSLQIANGTKTFSTDVYCVNFLTQNEVTYNGNSIYISGNLISNSACNGTTKFVIDGTGTLTTLNHNVETIINTTGTTTFSNVRLGNNVNNSTTTIFRHQQGTIVNPRIGTFLNYGVSGSTTFDLISGTTWDLTLYSQTSTLTVPSLVNFTGTCNFDNFVVSNTGGRGDAFSTTSSNSIRLSGATININNFQLQNNLVNPAGTQAIGDLTLFLQTGQTINVNSQFNCNGGINYGTTGTTPNVEIRTFNSGSTANLNINTNNQYISSTRFTDIDCSGGNAVYGQNLTLTRTTNITQYTLPPTTGGGGGSFTFVN
jgi:hypothetical protein